MSSPSMNNLLQNANEKLNFYEEKLNYINELRDKSKFQKFSISISNLRSAKK